MNITYECAELIEEIKQDIKEFEENEPCYLFYKEIDGVLIYTNYDFIAEDNPIKVKTTLKEALKLFEKQNNIKKEPRN